MQNRPDNTLSYSDEEPSLPRLRGVDYLLIGLVVLSWGFAFVSMKEMLRYAPPFKAGGIRFLLAALPLLVFALQPARLRRLRPGDFARFATLGFFQTTLLFGIMFVTLQHAPAGLSSILLNTNPFFVVLLAHFLLPNDRLSGRKVAGLLLGFGGVVTLVLGGKGVGSVAPEWPVLLLLGAFFWGFSAILIKRFGFQDMISLSAWQSLFGSLPLLALGFSLETQPIEWNWAFVGWLAYAAFVASTFAWLVWFGLLRRFSAGRITVFLFLVPVVGVLCGVIFLGESLSLSMLLGGALVVAGIYTVNSRSRRNSRLNHGVSGRKVVAGTR